GHALLVIANYATLNLVMLRTESSLYILHYNCRLHVAVADFVGRLCGEHIANVLNRVRVAFHDHGFSCVLARAAQDRSMVTCSAIAFGAFALVAVADLSDPVDPLIADLKHDRAPAIAITVDANLIRHW